MSDRLYKGVSLGAEGMRTPGSSQDYRRNQGFYSETNTEFVRVWADWTRLQPIEGIGIGQDPPPGAPYGVNGNEPYPGDVPSFYLANLDAQIKAANEDARWVVLVLYQFPTWTNRLRRRDYADQKLNKADTFAFPDTLDAQSPWGRWVQFMADRYKPGEVINNPLDAWVMFLEIVNEPNSQLWPQYTFPMQDTDPFYGVGYSACLTAQMFQTAQAVTSSVILAGPATDDHKGSTPKRMDYLEFTRLLLAYLPSFGFLQPTLFFAWSHHNYTDVTFDHGPGSVAPDAATNKAEDRLTNRAATVRNELVGKWQGWSLNPVNPGLLLTECGVQRELLTRAPWSIDIRDEQAVNNRHAELLSRGFDRMKNERDGEGLGIYCFLQYLFYSSLDFDSGIRNYDAPDGDGEPRIPPYNVWASKPQGGPP